MGHRCDHLRDLPTRVLIRRGAIVFSILAFVLAAAVVSGVHSYVRVAAVFGNDGRLTFGLREFKVHTFDDLEVWSEASNRYLWWVTRDPGAGPLHVESIVYGGVGKGLRQVYPDSAPPSPIDIGDVFFVRVSFEFDEFLTPSAGYDTYRFKRTLGGQVIQLELPGEPAKGSEVDFGS